MADPAFGRALTQAYSLEITARDVASMREAAPQIAPGTRISVAFLPGEAMADRVEAAAAVRALGFTPVPHLSARRLRSESELHGFLAALRDRAAIEDVFVIAGDSPAPEGPYADALALIRRAGLADYGVQRVGIAGYPEGHPQISEPLLKAALHDKLQELGRQGLTASIMTQFSFDGEPVLAWLAGLRAAGVAVPVGVGVPGPASVKTLLRFATHCGVKASSGVMRKYGLSLTKLLGSTGPDSLMRELQAGLDPAVHGDVRLHFYPFGGLAKTTDWIKAFAAQPPMAAGRALRARA
jgi:methylenetetrahydrofolate reductase (NADPH)